MTVEIICVGKIKEKFFRDALSEYEKRLSAYCRFIITELPDEKAPENLSDALKAEVLRKEGERILSKIKQGAYVITLEIEGEGCSSDELAARFKKLTVSGKSDIVFVIGGSLGLSDAVKARSDHALSFSRMTFPHQLMRVILSEQVYRAFKINAGEPYHK
ncbi:MAG: 23S rRNA (pseudouridine(1915)-N(3))-methyltransferase RlmH [Lachnospiraceae bacterium]|nr:23S rRNA (pseudouridine(1915)-N(3))-methyltransferase RlmH [Lachnospiraceae bacterium]